MFIYEQYTIQKTEKPFKNGFFKTGTTLATPDNVKKPVTYRDITLALGILVALLIALTFWRTGPDKESYGPAPVRQISIPFVETRLVQTVFTIFPALTKKIPDKN